MHEVKVFDSSGKLKKVISVKSLQKRSLEIIEKPSLFRKKGGPGKPGKTPAQPPVAEKIPVRKAAKSRKKA